MTLKILDDRVRSIIGESVDVEQVATGFKFTEGPVWDPRTGSLIFSDMPGDIMRRWSTAGGVKTFRQPCNKANGNSWDRQGRLVTCEHGSQVTRTEPDGSITVLATHYDGKELNSPNDLTVASSGAIYFSDPTYGRMDGFGFPREQDMDVQGVYRISPDGGEVTQLADDFTQPNGIALSVDETKLYVNDTDRGHIRLFNLGADGSATGGDVWVDVTGEGDGVPDGLKVDSEDNVYTTGPGGIHIFSPDGTDLGVIGIPEHIANFTWGDDDLRTMYVTASTSVYRLRVNTPGKTMF